MRLQFGYRRAGLAALAISFLLLGSSATLAGAAPSPDGRGRDSAPGQVKKEAPAAAPSAGTPTAADHPEGYSTHDAENGPGGQVCDGDPDNEPGAGGNYENTCPDGPSQNGAGDGQATGKPCAGCVGNADDKNPKGQDPSGPVDANNGYECDQKGRSADEGNNGVGYGNPAHTGCTATVTPPPPPPPATCPNGSPMPASGNVKDCAPKPPTCPNGDAMPASGDVKDCSPKPPTCPNGEAMPASGDVKDCAPKAPVTCPDGSAMPASGNAEDCGGVTSTVRTCPNGDAMPASGDAGDCAAAVLASMDGRPAEVLGVSLERAADPAVASANLARTGGFRLDSLTMASLLLAFLGLALVVAARLRPSAGGTVDIATRLGNY
jgi:hypothetical protein